MRLPLKWWLSCYLWNKSTQAVFTEALLLYIMIKQHLYFGRAVFPHFLSQRWKHMLSRNLFFFFLLVNLAAEKYLHSKVLLLSPGPGEPWLVWTRPPALPPWGDLVLSYVCQCAGHLIRACVAGSLCCRGAWRRQKADCINLSLIFLFQQPACVAVFSHPQTHTHTHTVF